jgi:hypothetical protein
MPEEVWLSVLASQFSSLIPVHATLNGCVVALTERGAVAADVEAVTGAPQRGVAVIDEDLRVARSWLVDVLAVDVDVDEDGRQALVGREAIERGWVGNPVRLSSLVFALVLVADAAVDR